MKIVRIARYEEYPSEYYKTKEGMRRSDIWDAWRHFVCRNYDWEEVDKFRRDLFCEGFSLDGIKNPPPDKEMWLFAISLTHDGSETMEEAAGAIRKGEYDMLDLDDKNKLMPLLVTWYKRQEQVRRDLERSMEVLVGTIARVR